jgi:predicted nucleic acid-binding protein
MILVDTSVIIAWLDPTHPQHRQCWKAIRHWAGKEAMAISSVTYAELAAGARTKEGVDEELRGFKRIELDFASAWKAGQAYRRFRPAKRETPVLPDFFIRAQAAVLNLRHLTNDRGRIQYWPEVEFLLPEG